MIRPHREGDGRAPAGGVSPMARSRRSHASKASRGRSSGSGASSVRTTSSKNASTSGAKVRIDGGGASSASAQALGAGGPDSADMSGSSIGRRPVVASNSSTPSEYRSLRASRRPNIWYSGAM
ncbi:MAG: hypothetical protein R3B70_38290 [Polyangiaceae bacterium]